MKKITSLLFVSMLGGALTLGSYKLFLEDENSAPIYQTQEKQQKQAASFISNKFAAGSNAVNTDFTEAANKTVHAVVHVKNVAVGRQPRTLREYMSGMRGGRAIQGAGSGVIITPDGYIVTNNHVIDGASELEVTLNNNLTYKAKVIGTDPQSDIALIKIEAEDLEYIPFGDSDTVSIGDWALAVGNPFNLTSTVTAGIISAKGRDLNEGDSKMQSFIQTDAAINPGNSGGALVNTNGELIGINTAITSQTGSYIGYGFAVPSNNARKIVEDILEYGDVQQAILGITGATLDPKASKERELSISQGVYVASSADGAKKAGLKEGDLITAIDHVKVRKLSDLTSYIKTKRPGSEVDVNYFRNGEEKTAHVKLTKYETFALEVAGVEITNADENYLSNFGTDSGVKIIRSLSQHFEIPQDKFIIIAIDDQKVSTINDVKKIMNQKNNNEITKVTFRSINGQQESYTFKP
ncbi:S1C family serine protease [Mesonia aestuariivivens]|uniref:Trypsin-like peptidase domain-containing protein n=1 Tax=Mesonia aestuariivivens TaxID=2796128 RepID=A0ABS6W0X5_9FLAO|nr:trypsin-like peptidase domain-containing protein [Mesonia aestuariivivens]MBW2961485.1 trypsin-like peptidase domain-containing protein [Mesonia aestuariivivens]